LKATAVAPVRFVPVIVTDVPTWPELGLKLLIVGPGTVKLPVEVAVPLGVVTLILPVIAPFGTAAVIWVGLFTVKDAAVPLNATAVAPVRFVPLIVTDVPACPLVGVKLEMVGADAEVTVNVVAELAVPPAVVTENFPLLAAVGTVAVIRVALFTENDAAVPLSVTCVAPVRFAPLRITVVPTGPVAGEKLLMLGSLTWREGVALAPPPQDVNADSRAIQVSNPKSPGNWRPRLSVSRKFLLFIYLCASESAKSLVRGSPIMVAGTGWRKNLWSMY